MATATNLKSLKNASVEDLSEQIAILKDDIATLTSTLGELGQTKTAQAVDSAKASAANLSEAGAAKAIETQQKAEEFIKTQPTTALGIAAGVGFLVGLMTARR